MGDNIRDSKARLRRQVLETLRGLTLESQTVASAKACELMLRQPVWEHARAILFFAPLPGELNIWPLLELALTQGKSVALPRFDDQTARYVACGVEDCRADVVPGRWNIREPRDRCAVLPLNRLDLILVPGVAFDLHGRRLGRGKGFYDQMLTAVRGSTCGIAFDEQIVREIPVEPHDIQVNRILTPTRWIEL